MTRQGVDYGILPDMRNITQDLIDGGTDCFQAVVDFCHEHDMEVFWSMRMNDTHDVAHHPDKPYFLYPPLKEEHPDWLVGNPIDRTPHGRWSSVDYAVPEIRDLAFRYIEEVCDNYDVDGIELDYFRHLCYFKSTAMGGKASDEERAMMTDLMRRIRKMTEERGMERGRPILVTVRVPDSVGYCRDMGFDIEKWLEEGLVDILVTTCYFRLNPWEYSVELGHKYGVQVYPCLSDSRVRGETRFRRSSVESYRGRAMNAWKAGADGMHLFNSFNPNAAIWKELGDPEGLLTKDKLYFVHTRDDRPQRFLACGLDYRTVDLLGPGHGRQVTVGKPVCVSVPVGDDLAAAESAWQAARRQATSGSPDGQQREPIGGHDQRHETDGRHDGRRMDRLRGSHLGDAVRCESDRDCGMLRRSRPTPDGISFSTGTRNRAAAGIATVGPNGRSKKPKMEPCSLPIVGRSRATTSIIVIHGERIRLARRLSKPRPGPRRARVSSFSRTAKAASGSASGPTASNSSITGSSNTPWTRRTISTSTGWRSMART